MVLSIMRWALIFLFLSLNSGWSEELSKADILNALKGDPALPATAAALLELDKQACKEPDDELIQALFDYQLAHQGASDPVPAQIMGRIYREQTDAFLAVYQKRPALDQFTLNPYLNYGWRKAIEGKNRSLPWVAKKQKRLDQLNADLMNVRPERPATSPY